MLKALLLGLAASFFFSITFVLNHAMQSSGGHWIWTASLRYVFMLPVLFLLTLRNGRYRIVLNAIKTRPVQWFLWSTVGFGLFYLPICVAASYGPSWMVASTWQVTIAAGILLTPQFRREENGRLVSHAIPLRQLLISATIIIGVFLVQYTDGSVEEIKKNAAVIAFILIAAFSYPLGNRKMLALVPDSLGTLDRVFGMTLCSMPFWGALMAGGLVTRSYPTADQAYQTLIVALSSGVIATLLFFKATELAKRDVRHLAVIESTQAGEVVFTLLLGLLLFGDKAPTLSAVVGIAVIVLGIVLNGLTALPKSGNA